MWRFTLSWALLTFGGCASVVEHDQTCSNVPSAFFPQSQLTFEACRADSDCARVDQEPTRVCGRIARDDGLDSGLGMCTRSCVTDHDCTDAYFTICRSGYCTIPCDYAHCDSDSSMRDPACHVVTDCTRVAGALTITQLACR